MNALENVRVHPTLIPLYPLRLGKPIGEILDNVGWNATETAAQLRCEQWPLSRLLNCKAGVSANMALEDVGLGTAVHWVRIQASYEFAQARRNGATAERRVGALHS